MGNKAVENTHKPWINFSHFFEGGALKRPDRHFRQALKSPSDHLWNLVLEEWVKQRLPLSSLLAKNQTHWCTVSACQDRCESHCRYMQDRREGIWFDTEILLISVLNVHDWIDTIISLTTSPDNKCHIMMKNRRKGTTTAIEDNEWQSSLHMIIQWRASSCNFLSVSLSSV